jgi:nucleoside-diphosphate-sugar epimerase
MRVLVIAGTGYIGGRVVERLVAGGHDVTVVHRGEHEAPDAGDIRHVHCDRTQLADRTDELRALQADVVLDMHSMSKADAEQTMPVIRAIAPRVVAISSADVYRAYGRMHGSEPGPPEPVPVAEDAPLRERLYPYRGERGGTFDDYDKIPVERIFAGDPRVACTVLRLPAVYGERDPQHRLRADLARMDAGRAAVLIAERARTWRWSWSYVGDVADAIALAVTDAHAAGRTYNVAQEHALTHEAWVRAVGEAAGWHGEIIAVPDADLPAHLRLPINFEQDLVLDSARIRADLGYREPHPFAEGLARTIAWERSVRRPDWQARLREEFEAEDEPLRAR